MRNASLTFMAVMTLMMCNDYAVAQPATEIAWTPETLAFVKGGDIERGKQAAPACAGCHGATGESAVPGFPSLGGQQANYLYRQMKDYKSGKRANPMMEKIASSLSEQTMADFAVWYSSLPLPAPQAKAASLDKNSEYLVKVGDSKRLIPGCRVCHGSKGQGEAMDVPALAGQQQAYLEITLLAYKQGIRRNDVYSRMRFITEQLTLEEIKRLSEYYAGLGR